ncbi:GlcNAc-PI de-N-acetylase [Rhodococcus sp. Leaf7]|uniref:PIG-L family deacetylase n=1 Tax=unclassified Rhodococcus (in: high G+C Gram-positive bacteria) TaxID=192944 RepID=UPI0006F70696|nr:MULTISPECIES: PIG-L family deacetylase [unclassified Rhodococcus (in: high G+C Gram-positive bacteria)]KQU06575.1 GlcNAc-PI de-N-acetylase [Rhodococcus sp. Leaf7]KQU42093.1 GlcNAc-PI de-N-acetylase [Rhodococcus sp. Leaf247]
MSVLVCFHAHPDDEVFGTGGIMRAAADAGHRVVLVTATDGALGEFPEGLLADGESLHDRRRLELERSAEILGVQRVVMLGYADSGMAGTDGNDNPIAFANAPVEEAARRLADVLDEEQARVLTVYDPNGGYGHPDHVQVHHVGVRAAELASVPFVYEGTMNRDRMREMMAANPNWDPSENDEAPQLDIESFGLPESELTTAVDVTGVLAAKRAAMVVHESQIGDFGPFIPMSDADLASAFGTEWFRRIVPAVDAPRTVKETALPL